MIQIFQFDQNELCTILINHLGDKMHKICAEDVEGAYLRETEMDGTVDFIQGQIQLVIGDDNEEAI